MKRDLDLIRKMLLCLEDDDDPSTIPGVSVLKYTYHFRLLREGGLIGGEVSMTVATKMPAFEPYHLTWAGHEFLDATRDNSLWKKTIREIKKEGGGYSFEIVKVMATHFLKEKLGITTD